MSEKNIVAAALPSVAGAAARAPTADVYNAILDGLISGGLNVTPFDLAAIAARCANNVVALRAAPAAEPGAAPAIGPWPMATEVDRKGGWTYAPEFLSKVADAAELLGDDGRPSMEQVEGVLKALAGAPGRAAPEPTEVMVTAAMRARWPDAPDPFPADELWGPRTMHTRYWLTAALRAGDAPPSKENP